MNITKRMLQFGAAAVAVAIGCNALAVGLTLPVEESFEGYAEGTSATNLTDWASTSVDDASIITNMTYEFNPVTEGITYPLGSISAPIAHQMVLKLNTEGGTLAVDFEDTSFASQRIYVDAMVNMVISEDDPSITDPTAKIAVWANATSNLVIRHGMYPLVEVEEEWILGALVVTNTVTDVKVDPETWYRLSIALKGEVIDVNTYALAQVRLDGVAITNDNARDNTWFFSAVATDNAQLSSVAFQGTGFIDDLLVSMTDPFAIAPSGVFYWVYVTKDGSGSFSTDAAFQVASGSSTSVVYTAAEWYRIGELLKDNVAVGAAVGLETYTQTLTDITANVSNHVVFAQATESQTTLGVPSSWASLYYSTEEAALADTNIETDYLLNLDPTGTYDIGFEIVELVVDTGVTVTVKLTNGVNPLDTTINGSLKVYGKVALDDADWVVIGAATIVGADFDAAGEEVVGPFDAGTYQFFKAIIE